MKMSFFLISRPLKNVFEAADARQKQAKKRSLYLINEHSESVFNTAAATQIVFQRPVRRETSKQTMSYGQTKALLQRSIMALLGLLSAVSAMAQEGPQPRLPVVELTAGMYVIQAEVAQTMNEQSIGLMYRRTMGVNEGMLFIYDSPQIRCFWMRNTPLPLTIAFIADDGSIVNLKDMQPETEKSHCATKPVRYALEMNQGWFEKRGLKSGFKLRGIPPAPAIAQ